MYTVNETDQIPLSKTLFCDDSSYTCRTLEGAQTLLNKIGFFAAAAGMELNIKKTFYVLMELLGDNTPLTIPCPPSI
jgi:hypothetical protein